MNSGKHDMSLEELFRQKLENADIMPSPEVNASLMKKLARREFVHFNPAKFNIYYLGIAAAAAITAGIMIFSGSGHTDRNEKQEKTDSTVTREIPSGSGYLNVPEGKVITVEAPGQVDNTPLTTEQATTTNVSKEEPGRSGQVRESVIIIPQGIANPPAGKTLFNDTAAAKLKEKPVSAKFEPSVFEGCVPLKVHFENKSESFKTSYWTFGDGGFSSEKSPDWIFDIEGEYKVVLNVFSNGMTSTYSVLINVHSRPQARFEITPAKPAIPDDEIHFVNNSINGLKYIWDFGDGNKSDAFEPKHRYSKYGDYDISLMAISEHGCIDTMTVQNAFSGSEFFIELPNAFIPNPDGPSGGFYTSKADENAEIFHPYCSGVTEFHMKIFSKRGILIFETSDVNVGWDGYFKGQLSNPGVYIWKIRGSFCNGEPFTKMGDITLLKN